MEPKNLVDRQIGPYLLLEQIGAGGMGVVYRATAPGHNDYVAVKVVGEKAANDPHDRQRFEREIRALSRLDHPYILPILDYGTDQDRLYMVMPFVQHGSLGEFLIHGCGVLTLAQAQMVARQVGTALDYAHSQGVIHRDVKPENIMMMGGEHVCLADFGLAKLTGTTLTSLTSTGSVMGTPAYMSPEQALGTSVDGRTDIYALGLVLYRCLLGRLPFYADTAIAMINQHISMMPVVPTAINPDFPHRLEEILLKALEKQPERRYQKVEEMSKAMDAVIARLPADLRTQALVTQEQIDASTQLNNRPTPMATAVLQRSESTVPAAEPAPSRRRQFVWLAVIAAIIVALALGIMALVQPIQERALHAEQTAQALMARGPLVITQLVTNEAGDPVFIEVTRMVTSVANPPSATPTLPPTATTMPTLTSTPTPTPTESHPGSAGAPQPTATPAYTNTPANTDTPASSITRPPSNPTNTPDSGSGVVRPPSNPTNTSSGSGIVQPPARPTDTLSNSGSGSGSSDTSPQG
jgi:serine/threonine protein kinase